MARSRLKMFPLLALCTVAVHSSAAPAYTSVNPHNDNIFLHITAEEGHSVIVSLIYFSFWLGALGWDIFSTLQFDWRVLRETNWKSLFSIANSLAYYVSRYGTFAWILRCLLDGITASNNCLHRFTISASLYGVCVCGTYFVFLLRTVNLWKMQPKAVVPLSCIMISMIALCAALPWRLLILVPAGDPFCSYQVGGALSYVVLATCAGFDAVNFVLLALKLSKPGIKGLFYCLTPQTKANYDHEEVSLMLLQRTGIFVLVQFTLLISIAALYATTRYQNYQLMQVAAFHAISASMAGRIFRRAWRLTREHSPTSIAQPPSYSPTWLGVNAAAAGSSAPIAGIAADLQGMGGIGGTPVPKSKEHLVLDDDASYIEGELQWSNSFAGSNKEKNKSALSIIPRTLPRTGAMSLAPSHNSVYPSRSSSEMQPGDVHQDRDETAIEMEGLGVPVDSSTISLSVRPAEAAVSSGTGKKTVGLGLARSTRAKTSHGFGRNSTIVPAVRARPSTSQVYISPPVQIITPNADATSSSAFMSTPTERKLAENESGSPAMSSIAQMPSSGHSAAGPSSWLNRPHSSGSASAGSCKASDREQKKDARPSYVASPPMTALIVPLPGSQGDVIDFAAAKAAASGISTAAKTGSPSEGASNVKSVILCARSSALDPLEAFHSAVRADEARHGGGFSDFHEDDARPRTSRGGPLASFGARESRRFDRARDGFLVLGDSEAQASRLASREGEIASRPRTSHGATNGSHGSFARLRSLEADHLRLASSCVDNQTSPPATPTSRAAQYLDPTISVPLTELADDGEQHGGVMQKDEAATDGSRPGQPAPSVIDETYRRLEEMASLSRTTTSSSIC